MSRSQNLLCSAHALARQAGRILLSYYHIAEPGDDRAASRAERASKAFLVEHLGRLTPDIPVGTGAGRSRWSLCPLGGRNEFTAQTGQFTVELALVRDGAPVLGVVVAPARSRSYLGAVGHGAFQADGQAAPVPIRTHYTDPSRLTLAGGRGSAGRGLSTVLSRLYMAGVRVTMEPLSSSLAVCRVAEGVADLAPLLTPTQECDTAAAQAILVAAGGCVTGLDRRRLAYDEAGRRNPPAVAAGDPEFDWSRFLAPSPPLPAQAWMV